MRTYATFKDNPHNPPEWIARMEARYGGTRLGRQELLGELIEDVVGALWKRDTFDKCRVETPPERLVRIVVAVDPAVSSGEKADDTGIVVCALGEDGLAYVLEDATCHLPPDGGPDGSPKFSSAGKRTGSWPRSTTGTSSSGRS